MRHLFRTYTDLEELSDSNPNTFDEEVRSILQNPAESYAYKLLVRALGETFRQRVKKAVDAYKITT